MAETPAPHPTWTSGLEDVIKKEAEQSQSLYWLHNRSETLVSKKNDYLAVPGIVLATLTGFLTGGAGEMIPSWVLGSLSVLVGILGTLNTYYKFAQRAEGHRVASLLYLKLFKQIEIEMSLPRNQRTDPEVLLKNLRQQMTQVSETAPRIQERAIQEYRAKFHNEPVSKPIVANGLEIVKVYHEKEPTISVDTPRPKISIAYVDGTAAKDKPPAVPKNTFIV